MQWTGRHWIVTAAVCAAAIGDVLTTVYGIETQALFEANPFVAQQLETGGYALWLSIKVVGAIVTLGLYGATRRVVADGYEWAGYTAPTLWIASHAVVTAHNGMLILPA